jgi:hypothetical protein
MTPSIGPTWASVPRTFRTLARWITIAQAAGFGVSLVFARETARGFLTSGSADPHQLLQSAHSHLLGMTALFAMSGFCFALCERPRDPLKSIVLAAPFLAIMLAFVAIYLMKYSTLFAWVLIAANLVMTIAFYVQVIATLRALRIQRTIDDRR